jgi:hypothetical protein
MHFDKNYITQTDEMHNFINSYLILISAVCLPNAYATDALRMNPRCSKHVGDIKN